MYSAFYHPCTASCCVPPSRPPVSVAYSGVNEREWQAPPTVYGWNDTQNWPFDTSPSLIPTPAALDKEGVPPCSPWVSPLLPELWTPVIDGQRVTVPTSSCHPCSEWTPQMVYPDTLPPSSGVKPVDANNSIPYMPPAPPNLPEPFMSGVDERPKILPPFSCFLNPAQHTMYPSRKSATTDNNNNDISTEPVPHKDSFRSSSPSSVHSTKSPGSSSPQLSPIPPAEPSRVDTTEAPAAAARTRGFKKSKFNFSSIFKPQRKPSPLRDQFPDLERITTDFITNLIKTAKFGEGNDRFAARAELENITLLTLRYRLFDLVPGLAERGISPSSVAKLLQPLSIVTIKDCLRDESAWYAVTEVLEIYDQLDSAEDEVLDSFC